MRFKEFKTTEGLDTFMSHLLGRAPSGLSDVVDKVKDATTSTTDKSTASISSSSATIANGYTPNGATPEQLKQFGPSSKDKINWQEMRSYVANKLSFNHAVAMVVNCKWESGFQPGRWVHSDASQGPSGGLFMFHDANFSGKGFFSDMVKACGGPGRWQTNWQGQIDFALSYGGSKGPAFAATKFRTPEEATHWFCLYFEKPKDAETKARQRAKEAHLYAR